MRGAELQGYAASPENINIILVDDDDSVREAVSEILARKGWRVNAFGSAESAIEELKGPGGYDVVLADINMPGMSGMEFLRTAKEVAPDVPVVMITGYPSIDRAVEAMKIGAVDFLPKPFKSEDLEIVIRKSVGEARIGPEVKRACPRERAISRLPQVARKRLEDKIKELSILHTISETLDEVSEKEDVFRKTLDLAQIIMDADGAFILVVEQGNRDLVVRAASGYEDSSVVGSRFSADDEPFRSVIRNKCYSHILVDGAELRPLMQGAPGKRMPLLLAPMFINREVVMLLGLTGKDTAEVTPEGLMLLLNLTAKASLKIENIALTENIFTSIIGSVNSLINALDARDTYTKDHSNRVTRYAVQIAKSLGAGPEVVDSIVFAGPLHDIGKIGVRDEILLKKGGFTSEEREIMKTHVVWGVEILKPLNLLASERDVVLFHHERWDGGGYPNGLSGEEIPLVARIFSVADTFDAMTSTRPYRTALKHEVARDEIIRCKGGQFDPAVVEAFLSSGILVLSGEGTGESLKGSSGDGKQAG